jgi:hypothetical protein
VRDIAERYLLPNETQDMALLFVPSESIYADLMEHFDDVVQRAHRLRVVIVSPSLLMMAVQVTQALAHEARGFSSAARSQPRPAPHRRHAAALALHELRLAPEPAPSDCDRSLCSKS